MAAVMRRGAVVDDEALRLLLGRCSRLGNGTRYR